MRQRTTRGEIHRLRSLVAINRAIVGAVDYDEVLRLVVDQTAAFTGADACVLLLAGDDGKATVAASTGIDPEKARRFSAPFDEHVDEALRAQLDFGRADTFVGSPLVGVEGIRGILGVYHHATAGLRPRREERFLIAALADQAAIALEHARYRRARAAAEDDLRRQAAEIERARDAERRTRESLQSVSEASLKISEKILALPRIGLESVLSTIASESRRVTGAEYAALGIGSDPAQPFAPFVVAGIPPDMWAKIGRWPRPIGTLGLVAHEGATLRIADVRQHPAHLGLPPGHVALSSFLGVPIQRHGRMVGNLFLANKQGAPEFTEQDEATARMLANRVAISMQIANLYDAEATGRAWLSAVIQQMPDAVVLLDKEGRIAAQSAAAQALNRADDSARDYPCSLDLCSPAGESLPPEDLPHVRALVRGEPTVRHELALRRPDGTLMPVLADAVQVRGPHGEVIGATAIYQDLSEHKAMERMREEWISVIAHDLRQPVSSIGLAARLLQTSLARPLSEQELKQFERITAGVERLRTMIGELLDLSLLDAHRLSIEPRVVDLATLVPEVVERTADMTSGHLVRVRVTGASTEAFADPARVEQVLCNLLSNASKYGAPGTEIRVDVTAREREIEIAVWNEGRGVAPEELPRLFQRFMRSRVSRAEGIPGIGLGLHICKGLVEAQGGRIWAESTLGESMCFRFTLPPPRESARAA